MTLFLPIYGLLSFICRASGVEFDDADEIKNNGTLNFRKSKSITKKEFKKLSQGAIEKTLFLDPFCKAILKSFLDKNPISMHFYKFLFKRFTHWLDVFDSEAAHSWDYLINLAFVQYANIPENESQVLEIINDLVIPKYHMLANSSFRFDIETFKQHENAIDDEFSVSAYLDRSSVHAFIEKFKPIFHCKNDLEAQIHFKILLWNARKDIVLCRDEFKYHIAILKAVPFKYLRKCYWTADTHLDLESFLSALAQSVYKEVRKSSPEEFEYFLLKSFKANTNHSADYSDYTASVHMYSKRNAIPAASNHDDKILLWDPERFDWFLTHSVFGNHEIMAGLSDKQKTLLELLQNPTHIFRYFALLNFTEPLGTVGPFFVPSLLFSSLDKFFKLTPEIANDDLLEFKDLLKSFSVSRRDQENILLSVKWNHLASVKLLFRHIIDPDTIGKALLIASDLGYVEIVKLIIDVQKIHVSKDYALRSLLNASENGHLEIVKLLLVNFTEIDSSDVSLALNHASCAGHFEIVNLFLELHRNDINGFHAGNALNGAFQNGHFEIVMCLLSNLSSKIGSEYLTSVLYYASKYGHVDIVKLIYSLHKSKIDEKDVIIYFIVASKSGHVEIVRFFLATLSTRIPLRELSEAFDSASDNGHLEIVALLRSRLSEISTFDVPRVLEFASEYGHVATVKYILDHRNADICEYHAGRSLILASRTGRVQIVRLLLVECNNINSIDMDSASSFRNTEIARLISRKRNGYNIEENDGSERKCCVIC